MAHLLPAPLDSDATTERIVSADGVTIACHRSGARPPLLLAHGTGADHTRWAPILPALEEGRRARVRDRAGVRGRSRGERTEPSERRATTVASDQDQVAPSVGA